MNIKKVTNGYIIKNKFGTEEIFQSIEEVFNRLLLHFEGKSEKFDGDSYGKVILRNSKKEN